MTRLLCLAGLLLWQSLAQAQQGDASESGASRPSQDTGIGYASVQEAYDALSADDSALRSSYEGWTVFNQKLDGQYIIWTFTPEEHPVHPSVVRRAIVSRDGEVQIGMDVLCYANPLDCDELVVQFRQINENLKARLENQ